MTKQTSEQYVGYVRVSSTEQAERNISIPSQIDQIHQYAEKNGISISKIYKEEHSAFKGTRSVFHQMLKDLEGFSSGGIVVFKMDRISRNPEDFMALEKVAKKKGLDILSVTEPMMNNYLGRYMYRDMQNRAILYSEELSFRTKLGMRKKLQMGGSLGGPPPYGFKVVGGRFEADESKGPVVQYIFNTYAQGKHGYKEIANQIKKQFNLPKFHWKNVYHTLINTHYIGYKTKERKLSKEECFLWGYDKAGTYIESYKLNYITPLITQELFDVCTAIREHKAIKLGVRSWSIKYHHNIRCICGRRLRREDKKNNRYLRCCRYQTTVYPDCTKMCCVNLNVLGPQIEKILDRVIPSKAETHKTIEDLKQDLVMMERDRELLLVTHNSKKLELTDKIGELTDSYLEGRLNKQIFEISTNKINDQLTATQEQINVLNDFDKTRTGYIKAIQTLESLDSYYELRSNKQKSSPIYELAHKTLSNLTVSGQKVYNYLVNPPFLYTINLTTAKMGRSTRIELATAGTTNLCSTNGATTDKYK